MIDRGSCGCTEAACLGQSSLRAADRRLRPAEFFHLQLSTCTVCTFNHPQPDNMPGKEMNEPCVDCQDAESILTVRGRRLCKYVGLEDHHSGCPLIHFIEIALHVICILKSTVVWAIIANDTEVGDISYFCPSRSASRQPSCFML